MCHHSDCGCERHAYVERGYYHHGGCRCSYHGYSPRHFPGREETIQELENYQKQLQTEAKSVQERLSEMKKRG